MSLTICKKFALVRTEEIMPPLSLKQLSSFSQACHFVHQNMGHSVRLRVYDCSCFQLNRPERATSVHLWQQKQLCSGVHDRWGLFGSHSERKRERVSLANESAMVHYHFIFGNWSFSRCLAWTMETLSCVHLYCLDNWKKIQDRNCQLWYYENHWVNIIWF